ncbi:MAG: carboxynorspermidine decarboxylase [Desulfopila sp.]|jgi:carboxynorspermidine decarboxylase|nr:carboxynorspermidine decarboxylase [Desulfopila sp.]
MSTIYTNDACPAEVAGNVPTPCYLISEDQIRKNCAILDEVQQRSGARILLALKAFALPALFPLIRQTLHGVCASGPIEAQLGREDFNREVHTYAPAYSAEQMRRVIFYSDHILFNSISQWHMHKEAIAAGEREIEVGFRVNPGYSEVATDLYNPCLPGSRFGLQPQDLDGLDLSGISGLHFHAMCEQNSDVLARILPHFEEKFGRFLSGMKWVNFGGGHHITREDYDLDLLCDTITAFREKYKVEVYLEPGEAVVLNGGFFVTSVLDLIDNQMNIAIVDSSAETHLPDVLAMPYRPEIPGSGKPGLPHTYRLGGISCLAGDVIGDYSFPRPLQCGDRLVFTDMALYTFVKNTTFNGVELPAIYSYSLERDLLQCVRSFGYEDYRSKLA